MPQKGKNKKSKGIYLRTCKTCKRQFETEHYYGKVCGYCNMTYNKTKKQMKGGNK